MKDFVSNHLSRGVVVKHAPYRLVVNLSQFEFIDLDLEVILTTNKNSYSLR